MCLNAAVGRCVPAGGRGAASAESFLEQGYAVIFLNRKRSMQPFERQVPARLLSCLSASTADFHVEATPEAASGLRRAVLQLQEVAAGNLLLSVEFQTIFDYLMVRSSIQACCVWVS